MEFLLAIPIIIIPLFFPLLAGLMAISFGRSFWTWFLIGLPLPFVANIILLCLPDIKKNTRKLHPIKIVPVPDEQNFQSTHRES